MKESQGQQGVLDRVQDVGQEADKAGERGQRQAEEGPLRHFVGAVGYHFASEDLLLHEVGNFRFEASESVFHHIGSDCRIYVGLQEGNDFC